MPALGIVEEDDCRPVERRVALGEPNTLQIESKRAGGRREFGHGVAIRMPGWQSRLEPIQRDGMTFEIKQDEERS